MRRPVLAVFLLILASSEYLSQVAARNQAKENERKHQSQDYKRMGGDHGGRGMRRAHILRDRNTNMRMHDQKRSKGVSNSLRDRRAGIVPFWPAKNSWVEGSIYKKIGKERKVQGFPKKEKLHNICLFSVCNFGDEDKKKKKKKKKNKKKKSKDKKKNNNNNNENYNDNHGIHDSNNNSIDTKNHPNDNHHISDTYDNHHDNHDDHHIPDTYDHHNDNHQDPDHISENIPDSDNNYAPNEPYNHSPENIPNSNNNFASDSKEHSFNSPENSPPFNHNLDNEPSDKSSEKNQGSHNNFGPAEPFNDNSKRSTRPYDPKNDYDPRYYFHSPENTPHKYDDFDPNGPYNHSPENTPHKYDDFDPDVPHHQGDNDGGEIFGHDDTYDTITDNEKINNDKLNKNTQKKDGHSEDIKGTDKKINPDCNNPYVLEGMQCESTSGPIDPKILEEQRKKRLEYKNKIKEERMEYEKKKKSSKNRHPQNSKGTNNKNRFLSHPLK